MTYEEAKGRYMPHEIIDLYIAGELSFEDCNLLLYGSKTPPRLIFKTDELRGCYYLDLPGIEPKE